MVRRSNVWTIVLAGGEGTRVSALTTDRRGRSVPKQYWRYDGRNTLLGDALRRARRLATEDRILTVVARHHDRWWTQQLRDLPPAQILVQERNRGTGVGLLLALMRVFLVEPGSRVVVLAADHGVLHEGTLFRTLVKAVQAVQEDPDRPVLLGMVPDAADGSYGWILPGEPTGSARATRTFVEKPSEIEARRLMREGALWNSFMLAASTRSLLDLFHRTQPALLDAFIDHVRDDSSTLTELYERLPSCDLSRDVLMNATDATRVMEAPSCGWTDLGTPERLVTWLGHEVGRMPSRHVSEWLGRARLDRHVGVLVPQGAA